MIDNTWKQIETRSGNRFMVAESPMLNKDYLDHVFYIYPNVEDAEAGSIYGATGFFVSVDSELLKGQVYIYGVTNAHVIEDLEAQKAEEVTVRVNTRDKKYDVFNIPITAWTKHPEGDDLAVFALRPSEAWQFKAFQEENFLLEEHFDNYGVGVGDHTWTIGKYAKHGGKALNMPAVRFGRISMLPFEKVHQGTHRDFEQESYLVETYSINGFSGSPVYAVVSPDGRPAKTPLTETRTFLVGIDWGHFDFTGTIRIDPYTKRVDAPSGMMCVVPAWKLKELLHLEEFEMQRKNNDKKVTKQQKDSGISVDSMMTKEEFEGTLKKVSRKINPSKSDQTNPK